MSFSNHAEPQILDQWFGATAPTIPATYHLGLFTAAPTDAGGGTEVSGNAYARRSLANDKTTWNTATGTNPCQVTNAITLTWAVAPSGTWGTVEAWGLFDASTAGNLIFWGTLTPKAIGAATGTPSVAPGVIVITQD